MKCLVEYRNGVVDNSGGSIELDRHFGLSFANRERGMCRVVLSLDLEPVKHESKVERVGLERKEREQPHVNHPSSRPDRSSPDIT